MRTQRWPSLPCGPGTRWIELGGRFVAPGFIDNHTHFDRAGELILGVNLLDVADEAGLVRRVEEARDRLPAGAPAGPTPSRPCSTPGSSSPSPAQLKDLKVMMTVVEGKVVYTLLP